MMPAAKHFDPVIGVDIHMIQPPGPVPPLPIPHPYVGIVFDAFDYAPIIGATVKVNMMNRAIAGTMGKAVPPHIPIGGVFVPPPPANEDENFMGSATVAFDGDAATYMALPALSCQSIGMPAPPRLNPKKKGKIKSLVLPTSVVLPIPCGPPVLIGGPPTISLMSMAMHLIGPIAKAIGKTPVGRAAKSVAGAVADKAKNAWRAAFKWMPDGFIKCKVLKAEPVDVRTGEVIFGQLDFELPGRLPIGWTRRYASHSQRSGCCGPGWETPADARLELSQDGTVLFMDGTGTGALFESLPDATPVREPVDGWTLHRFDSHLAVRKKRGPTWYFPLGAAGARELLVDAIVDRHRNALHFVRGPQGLEQVVESAGRRLEIVSQGGLIQRITLHHPGFSEPRPLVRYVYDRSGRLSAVHDALDQPHGFAWDAAGRLVRHTNRVGLSFHYEHDEAGRCVHAWGDGGLYDYRFTYDPDGRWTNFTDSLGHPWSVGMNEAGQIVRETDPLGGTTTYGYDAVGRTIAVVDPDGGTIQYGYDERGNLVRLVRADGSTVTVDLDDADRAVRVTDPKGAAWEQRYGEQGLLELQRSPLGAECRYGYDSGGRLISLTNPLGAQTLLSFNRYGELERIVDPTGQASELERDMLGNVVRRIDPPGRVTAAEFDAKGRLVRATLPEGTTVAFAYDAADRLIEHRDASGGVTQLDYAGIGKIRRRTKPDGATVEYLHDTEERLIAITNERGETHRFERDPLGRISAETDYWGQTRHYAYTPGGRLAETRDELGREIAFQTDALGRVLTRACRDAAALEPTENASFSYDANGNLVTCENRTIRIERAYDPQNRLVIERQGEGCTVASSYDQAGNRTARRLALSVGALAYENEITYRHDLLGRTVEIQSGEQPAIRIHRDAAGRVVEEELGQKLRRRSTHAADGALTALDLVTARERLVEQRYAYDATGNLTERSDSAFGSDRYGYDAQGRLISHQDGRGGARDHPCDRAGDRLITRSLGPAGTAGADEPWARIASLGDITYRFDAAGNLVERAAPDRMSRLSWDGLNRLAGSSTDGRETAYRYDPLGRRIAKEGPDGHTRFVWSGDVILGDVRTTSSPEAGPDSRLREWIYRPGTYEPLAVREVAAGEAAIRHLYYHNDPNGCPSRLVDEEGRIAWAARYAAWGAVEEMPVARVDNPLRLQGQYEDSETGLHYNRYRYYDPVLGSYSSRDPLGQLAGANLYQYAPNVLTWIDPLGLANCTVYRVDNPTTGDRVVIDSSGNVTIPDKDKTLHISFGDDAHAQYFAESGSVIKSFEVPEEVANDIRSRAFRQRDVKKEHKRLIDEADGAFVNPPPQIDDPGVSRKLGRDEKDCLGVTGSDIDLLEQNAVPGSGKIVPRR